MSYQLGAELLNFGALIGFMGVNLSSVLRYWVRATGGAREWKQLLPGLVGLLICFYLWVSLSKTAQVAGWIWMVLGILYGAYITSGYRKAMPRFSAGEE